MKFTKLSLIGALTASVYAVSTSLTTCTTDNTRSIGTFECAVVICNSGLPVSLPGRANLLSYAGKVATDASFYACVQKTDFSSDVYGWFISGTDNYDTGPKPVKSTNNGWYAYFKNWEQQNEHFLSIMYCGTETLPYDSRASITFRGAFQPEGSSTAYEPVKLTINYHRI